LPAETLKNCVITRYFGVAYGNRSTYIYSALRTGKEIRFRFGSSEDKAGKRYLDKIKRFDMPDFRPRLAYVREMKRYGILPKDIVVDAAIDVYATDRAYWRSLWYKPPSSGNQ
jgi:hypothetical protein